MKVFILLSLCIISLGIMAQKIQYPSTQKVNQSDNYFGTIIEDPYRWLEDDTAKNTAAWVVEENKVTQSYFEQIPFRNKLHKRLSELWNYPKYSAPEKNGEYFTFYKNNGLQNQALLYVQKGIKGKPEILIDPNKLSIDGTVALQATAFSKKQRYFAYAVSASGGDWQEINILDFNTKKLLSDKIEYVKFTGMSWVGDDGFYYSGYSKPKEEKTKYSAKTEYQKVFYHKVGTTQEEDMLIYEDKEHPLRYVGAGVTEDERFLILSIAEGTDGSEIKIKDLQDKSATGFITLVQGFSTNADVVDNIGDKILLKTNSAAPNYKLVLADPKNPSEANWKSIIPETKEPLTFATTGGNKIFAGYLKDANTLVNQHDLSGKLEHSIQLPGVGTAVGFGSKKKTRSFTTYLLHLPIRLQFLNMI